MEDEFEGFLCLCNCQIFKVANLHRKSFAHIMNLVQELLSFKGQKIESSYSILDGFGNAVFYVFNEALNVWREVFWVVLEKLMQFLIDLFFYCRLNFKFVTIILIFPDIRDTDRVIKFLFKFILKVSNILLVNLLKPVPILLRNRRCCSYLFCFKIITLGKSF